MRVLLFLLLTLSLPGCAVMDGYDRSYSLSYGEARIGVTLRPVKGLAK